MALPPAPPGPEHTLHGTESPVSSPYSQVTPPGLAATHCPSSLWICLLGTLPLKAITQCTPPCMWPVTWPRGFLYPARTSLLPMAGEFPLVCREHAGFTIHPLRVSRQVSPLYCSECPCTSVRLAEVQLQGPKRLGSLDVALPHVLEVRPCSLWRSLVHVLTCGHCAVDRSRNSLA